MLSGRFVCGEGLSVRCNTIDDVPVSVYRRDDKHKKTIGPELSGCDLRFVIFKEARYCYLGNLLNIICGDSNAFLEEFCYPPRPVAPIDQRSRPSRKSSGRACLVLGRIVFKRTINQLLDDRVQCIMPYL